MSAVARSGHPRRGRFGAVSQLVASLRPVATLLRPYRRWVLAAILVNVGIYLATIGAAVAGASLVGRALTGSSAHQLRPLIWVVVGLAVPLGVLGWLDMVVTHVMSFRLLHDLRLVLYERFRELAPAYLLDRRSGDVTRAAVADVELLEMFTSHMAPPIVAALTVPADARLQMPLDD